MSTLFGNLEIGRKALLAHQLALQVTSNNMSNVNTPGYSRQKTVLEEDHPNQTAAGPVGTGVVVKNIDAIRDQFIDLRLAQGTQSAGKQQALFNTLSRIQSVVPPGPDGLQEGISRLFNSFATLANNPESAALRGSVVSAAQNLTSLFNSTAQQFDEIQASVNSSIGDAVGQVNTLASSIAILNQQIMEAEGGGHTANNLRDQRQEYIRQMSEFLDVNYYESSDGTFNVSVAGGHPLVTANTAYALSAVQTAPQGFFQVKAGSNDITNLIAGGKVAGWIQQRDQGIPDYQNDLDTLANTIISQVNTQHAPGTDLLGNNPGVNFFNPSPAPTPPQTLPKGAALAFSVNAALVADNRLIAASVSGEPGDNANALSLAALANAKTLSGGTETFAEGYAALQFKVGTHAQSSQRASDVQNSVLTQLQNERDSVSGVSLDEEAIDLVRFQRAYQAATKFISTIDQLTGELIATFGVS